jgi:hypothetical protein
MAMLAQAPVRAQSPSASSRRRGRDHPRKSSRARLHNLEARKSLLFTMETMGCDGMRNLALRL